jgi:hypothetical protein
MMESEILWIGQKEDERVCAVLRSLRFGFDLRMEYSSGQMFGQMFATRADAEAAAAQRRSEMEGRGWIVS